MDISEDFREFLKLLNENQVKYLVVGGYAVAYHGHPRYTKDIDLWIWLDNDNAQKTVQALKDFGFGSLGLTEHDFLDPENVIQLGYPPNRIDLLTEIKAVLFDECYERKREWKYHTDLHIPFIGLDDLIATKKATARLQDLADAEKLEKIKKKTINKKI